jgi:DNA-binding PadR family transcriptional regulator
MSIRGAILGLLTERPMTGYEIAKRFDHALGRVWPARPNQVYTETEAGLDALTSWLLDRSPPEQQLRFDGLLKANFAFALPTDQRRMFLEAERRFWIDQVSWIESQMKHLPDDDTETTKARRLAAEAGRDLYRVMLAWSERYLSEADRPA